MKKLFLLLTATFFFALFPSQVYAIVRYVTPAGAGALTGSSWADASNDLQLTINNSTSGDEIWVAAGTYKPNRRADALGAITSTDEYNAFVLKLGVRIYGGFAGVETLLTQRNWVTNVTTLSGDLGAVGTLTDNAYHVVISSGAVGTAELNGFTITGGYGDMSTTITVNTIKIAGHKGGGIACYTSSPQLTNLIITSNYANLLGGGIYIDTSSPTITGVTIASNQALQHGGGIYNLDSSPVMTNIIVCGNSNVENFGTGGGIYNEGTGSNPTIINALIYNNNSGSHGGGIYNYRGMPIIKNSTIVYNSMRSIGADGGGVSGNATIYNSIIWGNTLTSTPNNVLGTITYNNTLLEGGAIGSGIISNSNPLFVNSASNNYHLSSTSPAKDIGNNTNIAGVTTDLDGLSRVYNTTVDLGAYEFQPQPDSNGILYVKKGSTGNGKSWANALGELADALSGAKTLTDATPGSVTHIWVAAGTYNPLYYAGNGTTNRDKAFVLVNNVKVFGGFAGSETSLSQQNWTANTTILSGDLGTIGTKTDNAYHVVISAGAVGTAELNGFVVTQGYAENWSSATINSQTVETCNGGGIICASSSPTLKNLNINNCYSWFGGGIYNTSSSPVLIGVIVDSNTGAKNGGGIFNTLSSSPTMTNMIIRNNITVEDWTKGGGIYNASSSNPTVTNSLIYKNNSHDGGGGIYSSGGTPTFINSTIVYNTMRISGGTGGGVNGAVTLQNCLIWGNKASTTTNNVSGTPTYTNTLVEGVSGAGIISNSNPLFVDASTDNYRLTRFSPVINKGSNALNTTLTDLDENSRIFSGGTIDLGAYEYQSADAVFVPDANGILYVKKGSNGSGNSWTNAIGELSDALFVAGGLSSVTQIWVATGTYFPTYAAGNGATNRDKAFVLIDNVKIYGGFAGTETTLSQRNINTNTTILSGDIGTIDDTSDNSYHVLISAGTVGTACLDGFTITKGNANGSSSISVNTSTIISQGSGGGIHLDTSAPTFANILLINNKATLGGGISLANSTTTFTNSSVDSNTSTTNGGGVYCYVSRLTFNSVTLTNNSTTTNGGGIFTEGWSSYLYLTNVAVKNNTAASGSGGGLYLYQIDNSSTYKGLLIGNNQAGQNGGGIFTLNCTPIFVNLTLTENKAGNSGGGLYKGADFTMKNCIIWGNTNSNTSAVDNCSDITTNWYYDNTLLQGGTVNGTNIISNSNPLFVNSTTGNYHLTFTSPAKDAGNNSYINGVSTDLDGLARIYNTTVDLGAYEFAPAIRYVTPTGAGTGTGTSWANASSDLQLMINNSNSVDQIWVAAGTYKPIRKAEALGAILLNDRHNAFVLKSGVKIYGGFSGTETLLNQRNWVTNVTTLSGDLGTVGTTTDNAYHVVISSGAVGTAELNGFTITGGIADKDWDHYPVNGNEIVGDKGGGIVCYSSSPILTNLNVNNCLAASGGGMYNTSSSSPSLTSVTIAFNNGTDRGGGMYNALSSSPVLSNVIIQSNSATYYGGGMYNDSSSPTLSTVTIESNTTNFEGGGVYNISSSSPTMANVIIRYNSIIGNWHNGGGIYNGSSCNPIITNALIYKNTCKGSGGGIANDGGAPVLTNVTIAYNTITETNGNGNGAGIFGNATLKNSIIWGNTVIGATDKNVYGTLSYSNTLLEGGSGTGIISSMNPLFANVSLDDYHLTRFSKAINAGSNAQNTSLTDLDGNSRIFNQANGGIIDLGAFEFQTSDGLPSPDANGILYVKKGSTGTGDSWSNAVGELADALVIANGLSSVNQIWVSAGTYYPLYPLPNGVSSRDNTFVFQNNVKVYGGFVGTESALSQRNFTSNVTTLSGDIGIQGNISDDCFHVISSLGNVGTACLDGFTIIAGNANGTSSINSYGSSISQGNGGGISLRSSAPALLNLIIKNNFATNGGGIALEGSSSTPISNSVIHSNTTTGKGGGIYSKGSTVSLNSVSTFNNIAGTNGGGICSEEWSTVSCINVSIKNNIATSGSGGGLYSDYSDQSTIKNLLVCDNEAGMYGGGIFDGRYLTAINTTLAFNKAGLDGGGIYTNAGYNSQLRNSIVWGNKIGTNAINNTSGTVSFISTLLEGGSLNANIVSNSNPKFINTLTGDYHLSILSPAIGLGINAEISSITTDIDGLVRVFGTNVDLGAYESHDYPITITGANGIIDGTGYFTLKTAFDAINVQPNQTGRNIIITVVGSTTETATASLNNGNWTTLSIYPTTTGLSIKGAAGVLPITFNGADNVTIDGRLHDSSGTLTGSTVDLKISVTETLDHVTVNNVGSGYTSAPTVVFTPTNGGTGATATASLSGNTVSSIAITNAGSGYLTPPTISFTGGAGSGAAATAYVASKGTIAFDQNAQNNTVKYCRIEGAVQSDSNGTIAFLAGTAANGNGGNTISNNIITNNGVSRPQNSIISTGSTTYPNKGNIITNNEFKDFLATTDESRGIYIVGSGSNSSYFATDWTITGNSFYETTALSPSTNSRLYAIKIGISDASVGGEGFTISDNYIGGSAANCAGTWNKTATGNNYFSAITLNLKDGGTVSNVQNNTIKNFNWANNGGVTGNTDMSWNGIQIGRGDINIGTVTGNTIGDNTTTGSIIVTGGGTTDGSKVSGILIQWQGNVTCQNNRIGSITTANTNLAFATHIYGIYNYSNNATTISNNIIGSVVTPNSINATSASSSHDQSVYGILNASVSGSTPGLLILNNNTIANLSNNGSTSTTARINGIRSEKGSLTITNNTIRNLTTSSINSNKNNSSIAAVGIAGFGGTQTTINGNVVYNINNTHSTFTGSVVGVYLSGGTGINEVSNNSIYNLSASGASVGTADIIGLYFGAGTNTNTVSRNFIQGLSVPGSTTATLFGVNISSGATTYSNNIINLGDNNRSVIYGIYENGAATNNNKLYFNTVCIGGTTGSGATNKSYCLYSNSFSNTRNFRNNIFSNIRSTADGSSLHYAAWFNYGVSTNLTLDNNDYYAPGVGGKIAHITSTEITALPIFTGLDTKSIIADPVFVNPGSTVAADYKIGVDLVGASGTGITTDYELAARGTYTAMGAWERLMNRNNWKGTISSNWSNADNWLYRIVPATDEDIYFATTPSNNCSLDADVSITNLTNAQSTYKFVLNGHKAVIKGNFSLSNGAQLDASATGSTIEFAGIATQSIPSTAFLNSKVYNLTVNNATNVTFAGTLNLLNTLTATSGKLDATTNSPTLAYAGTTPQTIGSGLLDDKAYNLLIDNAAGVSLNTDFTVQNLLTINAGKRLTIPTQKLLNVVGTIANNAGVDGLIIKASPTGAVANGSLIFHNTQAVGQNVPATVEMYSLAAKSTNYKWQFFGIPLRTMVANPTLYGSYVREMHENVVETTNRWVQLQNSSNLTSFTGYEITQEFPKTIYFQGDLENKDYNSGKLSYTPAATFKGEHLIGNPYTAAIDIKKIVFGSDDAGIIEKTVYLYNTGSFADWDLTDGAGSIITTTPGQYNAVPTSVVGATGIPSQVPPMQAFTVVVKKDDATATVSIPYSSTLTMLKSTEMQRSKAVNETALSEKVLTLIDVKGSRYADRMWIFSEPTCTRGFDNGWDGTKSLGSAYAPQIFAMEPDGIYQVNSVDDINETELGFQTGEDTNYTLTFTNENIGTRYSELYLMDLIANKIVDITQSGTQYAFTATQSATPTKRFKIVTNAGLSTEIPQTIHKRLKVFSSSQTIFIHNFSDVKGELMLYNSTGQFIKKLPFSSNGVTSIPTNLPAGSYLAKGIAGNDIVTESLIIR